jgi:hypothetical protein
MVNPIANCATQQVMVLSVWVSVMELTASCFLLGSLGELVLPYLNRTVQE